MIDDLKFYFTFILIIIAWQVMCLWLAFSEVVRKGRVDYLNFVAGMLGLILTIAGWWGLISPQRFTGLQWWVALGVVLMLWAIGFVVAISHNLPDDYNREELL
ncbi:MAG TPA: hypothetical protein VJB93_03715 [Patescibacteria group bacterium]|nr:hypothetical protein [Patescibacteria group bacterium]